MTKYETIMQVYAKTCAISDEDLIYVIECLENVISTCDAIGVEYKMPRSMAVIQKLQFDQFAMIRGIK